MHHQGMNTLPIRTLNLMEHFVFRKRISSSIGNDQSAIHITSKQENNYNTYVKYKLIFS